MRKPQINKQTNRQTHQVQTNQTKRNWGKSREREKEKETKYKLSTRKPNIVESNDPCIAGKREREREPAQIKCSANNLVKC